MQEPIEITPYMQERLDMMSYEYHHREYFKEWMFRDSHDITLKSGGLIDRKDDEIKRMMKKDDDEGIPRPPMRAVCERLPANHVWND